MIAGVTLENGPGDHDHAPYRGDLSPVLRFDTFYLCAKFDNSSLSRSRDIVGGLKI